MPKFYKKIILFFLAAIILFVSTTAPLARAQTTTPPSPAPKIGPWYNQSFTQWSNKVFDENNANEIFGERYTFAQVSWIIHSLTAILIGSDLSKCIAAGSTGDMNAVKTCMGSLDLGPVNLPKNTTPSPAPSPGGMIPGGGTITGLAGITGALVASRPASGVEYIKQTASRLHIIPEAYAQGVGYTTLSPVQKIWSVVRNISYALTTVVIIAMAFMIMFRVKISPQVAITVQSALPKIVIALILITFSYAIAGFLIDLAYLAVGAVAVMIKTGGNDISTWKTVPEVFTQLTSGNGLLSVVIPLTILAILAGILGFAAVTGSLGIAFTGVGIPLAITILVGSILILLFAIIILFVILRLFWLMFKTAVITVLLIIIGPIMILMGTLSPTGGFSQWIKTLAANVAVYPTVIVMIFLSHYFFWGWFIGGESVFAACGGPTGNLNTFCINTKLVSGDVNLPGMPMNIQILGIVVALVILFLIPKAADIIQSLISGKPFALSTALGEATNPLGMRTFGTGVAKEALGEYLGRQLYRPGEGGRPPSGFIPESITKLRAGLGKPTKGPTKPGGPPDLGI